MAKTSVIPEALLDRLQTVLEPLSKLEGRITELKDKVLQLPELKPSQLRNYFNDLLKRVREAQSNVEKAFAEGVQWTLSMLNLPSKDEVEELKEKVAKLEKEVKRLKTKKAPAKKGGKKKA